MNIPKEILNVAECIHGYGGRAFLVGGTVTDFYLGVEPKDWDIEVYGIEFPKLKHLLESKGYNPKLVGESFGVIKVNNGLDIDISVPRRDNKTGLGHKDFEVELDPYMSIEDAARRRDLTINTISMDLLQFRLMDPYDGMRDLKAGIIRATDSNTFIEDPLRVLRIMQLLPRKAKTVDPMTVELCRSLKDTFSTLPPERVFSEFEKLLMKAKRPSIGIRFLQHVGWLEHFPELHDLVACPQSPTHHPEGGVYVHSLRVLDNAATVKEWVPEDWRLAFMFSSLLHDVGKPSTTDIEDNCSAKGHDKAGVEIAKSFMLRLTNDKELIEKVITLVGLHMQPYSLTIGKAKKGGWRRLQNKCRLDVLGFLSLCDRASAVPEVLGNPSEVQLATWENFLSLGAPVKSIEHKLMGRHLIDAGLTPGPEFSKKLKIAYEAQLDNDNLEIEDLLKIALGG